MTTRTTQMTTSMTTTSTISTISTNASATTDVLSISDDESDRIIFSLNSTDILWFGACGLIVCLCCFSLCLLLIVIRSHRAQRRLKHANRQLNRSQSTSTHPSSKSPDVHIMNTSTPMAISKIEEGHGITPEHSPQSLHRSTGTTLESEAEHDYISPMTNPTQPQSEAADVCSPLPSMTKPPNRRVRSYSARDTNTLTLISSVHSNKSNSNHPDPQITNLHHDHHRDHHNHDHHDRVHIINIINHPSATDTFVPPLPETGTVIDEIQINGKQAFNSNVVRLELVTDRRGSEISGITGISSIPSIPGNTRYDDDDDDDDVMVDEGIHIESPEIESPDIASPRVQQQTLNVHPLNQMRSQQSVSMQSDVSSAVSLPPQVITADQQWKQQMWRLQQQMLNIPPTHPQHYGVPSGTASINMPFAMGGYGQKSNNIVIPSDDAHDDEEIRHQVTESVTASEMSMTSKEHSGDTQSPSSSSSTSSSDSESDSNSENEEYTMTVMSSVSHHHKHRDPMNGIERKDEREQSLSGLQFVNDMKDVEISEI